MSDPAPEHTWSDEEEYDGGWEVFRTGDQVTLIISSRDGSGTYLGMSPEDAVNVGLALVQAGQEPE